jgi:chromosome partitioning protein
MPVVVAFVSQKGGVGKSTLARALGAVAAHAGLKIKIADLDPRQDTIINWQKARSANRVSPTLTVESFWDVDAAVAFGDGSDILILDVPGGAGWMTLAVATKSHLLVQPTGASFDDLRPAVLLFHELVKAGIPKSRLILALCRVLTSAEEKAARSYLDVTGYEALAGSIRERAGYRDALNRGRALTETEEVALNKRADVLMESLLMKIAGTLEAAVATEAKRNKGKGGSS